MNTFPLKNEIQQIIKQHTQFISLYFQEAVPENVLGNIKFINIQGNLNIDKLKYYFNSTAFPKSDKT